MNQYFNNDYIYYELKDNYNNHTIFECQDCEDLNKVREVFEKLKEVSNNNIIIEINGEEWNKYRQLVYYHGSYDNENYYEHELSLLIMQTLEKEYKINSGHDLDLEQKYLTCRIDDKSTIDNYIENYLNIDNTFLNRKDIIEAIKCLNLEKTRIHFLISRCNDRNLYRELSNYLQDNLPFNTIIYLDIYSNRFITGRLKPTGYADTHFIWEIYDYTKYYQKDKGKHSFYVRQENGIEKVLPDTPKQKVLK